MLFNLITFNLITLPVEIDASGAQADRASTDVEEETAVAKVLRAAAWTYVAAFITSLGYFLFHLLPLIVGRRE